MYQFYRNEIVKNEETGKFNLSVSSNPDDVLLKEDEDRISLYRSSTEGNVSYRWYGVGDNDFIFVTKKEDKYNYTRICYY